MSEIERAFYLCIIAIIVIGTIGELGRAERARTGKLYLKSELIWPLP